MSLWFSILLLGLTHLIEYKSNFSDHSSDYRLQEIVLDRSGLDSLNRTVAKMISSNPDSAEVLAKLSLGLGEDLGYDDGVAYAVRNLAVIHYRRGDYQTAKVYYKRNLEIRSRQNDPVLLAKAYSILAQTNTRLGEKTETLDNLLKALRLIETTEDRLTFGKVLDALGNHYRSERSYKDAQKYYQRALNIRLEQGDSVGLLYSYQVIGNLYGVQDMNSQAKSAYREGLKYTRGYRDNRRIASISTNLGITYYKEQVYDSARFYYTQALSAQRNLGNRYSEALILNNLTALEYELENYSQAIGHAQKGVKLARETGASELLSSLYYNLSDSYKALGDYKRSFEYYKLSDSIDYEITNTEKNAQLAELQVKFDTEKKDKEIAQQNLDLAQADIQKNRLFAGIALLALIAGFIFWSLVRKRRSNARLQAQKSLIEKREQEKALLLRELHHRVKNNFQVVSSLLNLQYYEAESTGAAEAIKAGQTRVEAMSMIHRELYQGDSDTALEMKDYVVHLIENAIYMYDFEPEAVDLQLEIDDSPLDVKYAIPLGIIINELITNAFKHAFQSVAKPALSVYLDMDKAAQKLTLKVGDNGPGIPESSEAESSSFGLELIGDLMKQLKGELTSSNQDGATFTIVFPYISLSQHVES